MHMHIYMHTEDPMWEEGCCRQDEGVCKEEKGQKSKGLGGWRDDALLRVSPRRRQTPLNSGRRPGRRGGTWRLVATRHSWGFWRVHSSSPQADVWSSTGNRKLIHSERPFHSQQQQSYSISGIIIWHERVRVGLIAPAVSVCATIWSEIRQHIYCWERLCR